MSRIGFKYSLLLIVLLATISPLIAQNVIIPDDNTAIDNSAILDIRAINRGLLIPRLTELQRNAISNPANALLIYQTNNAEGYWYNSGTPLLPNWVLIGIPSTDSIYTLREVLTEGDNALGEDLINLRSISVEFGIANCELQLNESSGVTSLLQFTETANGITTNDGLKFGFTGSNAVITNEENNSMTFATNISNRLFIANSGEVTIGTAIRDSLLNTLSARFENLNINSAFTIPNIDGSVGQIMATDGAGLLAWRNRGDSMGNHIASQNIRLNDFYLSNDSDNEGVNVSNLGRVGISAGSPLAKFSIYDATNPTMRVVSSPTIATNNIVDAAVIELSETNTANFETLGTGFRIRYVGNGSNTDRLEFTSMSAGITELLMCLKRTSGFTGIKIQEPANLFHLVHDNVSSDGWAISNSVSTNYWHFNVEDTNTLVAYYNNAPRFVVDDVTGGVTFPSDKKFKKNILTVTDILQRVMMVEPKQYHFIHESTTTPIHFGVMAQDLLLSFPELVHENTTQDDQTMYTVNYKGLNAIALAAVADQKKELESLKRRLQEIEKELVNRN